MHAGEVERLEDQGVDAIAGERGWFEQRRFVEWWELSRGVEFHKVLWFKGGGRICGSSVSLTTMHVRISGQRQKKVKNVTYEVMHN